MSKEDDIILDASGESLDEFASIIKTVDYFSYALIGAITIAIISIVIFI